MTFNRIVSCFSGQEKQSGGDCNKYAAFSETELQLPMPRITVIKAPDGSSYKIVSTIEDVIEKQSPAVWFGAYAFLRQRKYMDYQTTKPRSCLLPY